MKQYRIILLLLLTVYFFTGCFEDFSSNDNPADTTAKWGTAKWGEGKWNP